ncbi:MFS transporter [Galactobacter sp.]|uniref:CynX/NimT family MFS transporter n=1 Tax=Galactobacter sp. TaxID=2676125 RepID=UPI0025BB39FA|nr:MFS transporter [Galactobacter sp.]
MSLPTTAPARMLRPALLLAGIFLLAANMRGALTVVSPLMGEIRADLDIGSAGASALISLPLLCFAAVSPLAPKLARRFGTEATLTSALVLLMVGIVLRSLPLAALLWVGTVLIGSAIACINVLLPSLLKRDFPDRVGSLTGAYNGVQSAFAALAAGFAVPIAGLPGSGWRLALGFTAAIALIGIAVMLPQLRVNAPQPAPEGARRTEVSTTVGHEAGATQGSDGGGRRPSLLRSAVAWQVALFMGLQSCVFYSMVTWWPTIEHSYGISTSVAGVHAAVFQATGIVGSLVTGAALKRAPRPATVTPVVFSVIGVFGMVMFPAAAIVWTIVIGLGAGGCIVAALALFSARTRDHHRAAELSGMGQSVGYLLAAALPPTLGFLHDATHGWQVPLLALGGTIVLALVFAALGSRDRVVE